LQALLTSSSESDVFKQSIRKTLNNKNKIIIIKYIIGYLNERNLQLEKTYNLKTLASIIKKLI